MLSDGVAAVVLAAGQSSRFGQPKQLLAWQGRPLVVHIATRAWVAGLTPTAVVLGCQADRIASVLDDLPIQVLTNYHWAEGMSTSLNIGLSALPQSVEAAIFLPVDQPLISISLLHRLVAHWQENRTKIVAPCDSKTKRRRGSPALFPRAFFSELAHLSGDVGGRVLLNKYNDHVVTVPVDNGAILTDVDTPEAYARLRDEAGQFQPTRLFPALKGVIADMDGVLWHDQTPLPGLHEFFDLLRAYDLPYMLVTNNSSRTPEQYAARLKKFGLDVGPEHILNSSLAAADYLAKQLSPGAWVYPIGGPGVSQALVSRGFRISEGDIADYVVVGWDRQLTWAKLATATRLIYKGAGFLGTNPDLTFPTETGPVPGNGAQVAAVEAATNVQPVIAGKPAPELYHQALHRMGMAADNVLMIGDRLETDILGALRLGMKTALLFSGVTTPEVAARSPIMPDMTFETLASLVETWQQSVS